MSERYTSGSVGRFGFPEANLAMEAADAMVGRMLDDRKEHRVDLPRPFAAELTADLGDLEFQQGGNGYRYKLFNWVAVEIDQTSAFRRITRKRGNKDAVSIGEYPKGRAIQLSGNSSVKDVVIMHRIMQTNGTPFYCFAGTIERLGTTSLLDLGSEPELTNPGSKAPPIWKYSAFPVYWDYTPRPDSVIGDAYNLYESSQLRKQKLDFQNPDSSMSVDGPIRGRVFGTLASKPGTLPNVWVFEAVNPMIPRCDEGLVQF